jgi:hypothetical protein
MFDVFYFGPKPNLFEFERPASSLEEAGKLSRTGSYWYIYGGNDYTGFDFEYVPPPWQSHFTHVWGDQHQPNGNVYLTNNHSADWHFHSETPVHRLPLIEHWHIPDNIDSASIDIRWCPDPCDPPYRYHVPSQHQSASGAYYEVPGATADKLIDAFTVEAIQHKHCWTVPDYIDDRTVDYSWHPNPLDPPYIYHFPSQHQSASGVTYTVPGATDIKLSDAFTVTAIELDHTRDYNWAMHYLIERFDFSWHPNPLDPPCNYVWGNQWYPGELDPTVEYIMEGAVDTKYMTDLVQCSGMLMNTCWDIADTNTGIEFDWSWHPNPKDPPYIYAFGNKWVSAVQRPAILYAVDGATKIKYMDEPRAESLQQPDKFITHHECEFDYSWEPDPGSPAYNYVFGNQWYPGEVMPTVEYRMAGATETKYVDVKAKLLDRDDNWYPLVDCEFDHSWVPDPGDPPLIYVFGNQHWSAVKMPTVEYHVAGATERKYMDYPTATLLADRDNWAVPEEINEKTVDFSWVPDPGEPPYIYHFGSDYQQSIGLTYTVPGATELKFGGPVPTVDRHNTSVMQVLDIFFIDRGNPTAQPRYDRLSEQYEVTKVRYANSMTDTIKRCATRAKTNKFWVISSEYDYSDFDFHWHAQPWQSYMTHVFPSQHQKWGDTFLINKWEFERHTKWANSLEEFPNLHFVTDQTVKRVDSICDMYYVDHGNHDSEPQYYHLRGEHPDLIKTRAVNDYLDTFKRIVNLATTEYVWILNSVCNYKNFDFTWQPEPWQKEMIHVFSSNSNKRGDTFYIHVESFKKQMVDLDLLDWFNVINYCTDQKVDWFPVPTHFYESDNLVEEIKNHNFEAPYVLFTNQNSVQGITGAKCLWSKKDRIVDRMSKSGATSLVPREIKAHLKSQIYDYPYLDNEKTRLNDYYEGVNYPGCDIIYISNGEPDEEQWFKHLEYVSNGGAYDDVQWVRGVNGRTAAYQEAARRSRTPWFLAVFAKLEANPDFDWQWMPDYWQEPKHYIFNARNPVNDLEYGHQGMIAYNKRLVLENNNPGLDFTLSQPHESVPLLSGTAHFNQDAWMTWRTAFREVIKLKHFMATQPTLETDHRLNVWLNTARGNYSNYCLDGARDAVAYYEEVNGDYAKLMLSFEWAWLRSRFDAKY